MMLGALPDLDSLIGKLHLRANDNAVPTDEFTGATVVSVDDSFQRVGTVLMLSFEREQLSNGEWSGLRESNPPHHLGKVG